MVLNPSDSKAPASLRWFVAITPLAGAMVFPLVVPLVMARVGIGAGVGVADSCLGNLTTEQTLALQKVLATLIRHRWTPVLLF